MTASKKLTLSAVFSAIVIILLLTGAYLKTGTLAVYTLSTLIIMALICETDIKYGLLSYITVSVLSFFIVPDKYMVFSFVAIFGLYAVLKCIFEKSRSQIVEWVYKILFFNAAVCAVYFVIKAFAVNLKIPAPVLWIGADVFLIVYDIILSFCISYYKKYISPKLHLNK